MKFSLFRLPAVRKFDYKPIYFDPEKELREQRRRALLDINYDKETSIGKDNTGSYTSTIKGAMRRKHQLYTEVARKEKQKSNIRLAIIALILSAIAYYLYTSSGEWHNLMLKR